MRYTDPLTLHLSPTIHSTTPLSHLPRRCFRRVGEMFQESPRPKLIWILPVPLKENVAEEAAEEGVGVKIKADFSGGVLEQLSSNSNSSRGSIRFSHK